MRVTREYFNVVVRRYCIASRCHKDAILKVVTFPATTHDISETLYVQCMQRKKERRQCFIKLLSNIRFLAQQGLPLHGAADESDSNFIQLFKLHGNDNPKVFEWLRKLTNTHLQKCKMK